MHNHNNYNSSFWTNLNLTLYNMIIFGFPIVLILPIYLQVTTTNYSIIYRAICVILMFSLLFAPRRINTKNSINNSFILLLIFWLIFISRMVYDFELSDLPRNTFYEKDPQLIYLFTIFLSFLPVVAIYSSRKYLDLVKLEKFIYMFVVIHAFAVLIGLYFNYGMNLTNLFFDRTMFAYGANTISHPLNPISVGRAGSILFIITFYNFFLSKKINFIIFFMMSAVGMTLILLGSSKGPLITTIILLLIFFLAKPKIFITRKFFLLSIIIILTLISIEYSTEFSLVKRFSTPNLNEAILREDIWFSALHQFFNNPILGDSILDKYGMYPHNIYIEVLMSVGIVGAIPFYLIFLNVTKKAFYLLKNTEVSSVPIILFCFMLFTISSGSIYFTPELWVSISFILFSDLQKIKNNSTKLFK